MRKSILVAVLLAAFLPAYANPHRSEEIDQWEYVEPEPPAAEPAEEGKEAVVITVDDEVVRVRKFKNFSVYYVHEGTTDRLEICERPPLPDWAAR